MGVGGGVGVEGGCGREHTFWAGGVRQGVGGAGGVVVRDDGVGDCPGTAQGLRACVGVEGKQVVQVGLYFWHAGL